MIGKIGDIAPKIGENSFVAETATVLGDVEIADHSAVFFGVVIRGDLAKVTIGSYTNIQDNSVIHLSKNVPTQIGNHVTVGHCAVLHGCTIGDNCLIGIKSVIMDHAEIGENTIVGAMTFIGKGKKFPPGVMIVGIPARVVRPLTTEEIDSIKGYADRNQQNVKMNYLGQK
jgi:carbonic anhydrase/acetyltransferase-like protein (isoleucine patch superfamily)